MTPEIRNAFSGGKLAIGNAGATAQLEFDPESPEQQILNVDKFSGKPMLIPKRAGGSDVQVKGMRALSAQNTFSAQMAHYANVGGFVEIRGKNELFPREYKVKEFDARANTIIATDFQSGTDRIIDLREVDFQFGLAHAKFEARPQSLAVDLANVEGPDAMVIRGGVNVSTNVDYHGVLNPPAKGFDQHKIPVELTSYLTVKNHGEADFQNMELALNLNDSPRNQQFSKSAGFSNESMADPTTESATTGLIRMPVRNSFNLGRGSELTLNFSDAVIGKPGAGDLTAKMTADQVLKVQQFAPAAVEKKGETELSSRNPFSSFKLQGTGEHRPKGSYTIFDEGDVAASQSTYKYTPKGKEVTINAGAFGAIKAEAKDITMDFGIGAWVPAPNQKGYEQAVVSYKKRFDVKVESKSAHRRDVDFEINLGQFNQGIDKLFVNIGEDRWAITAAPKFFEYDADKQLIKVRLPVPAMVDEKQGGANISVTFEGKQLSTRRIQM